MKLSVYNRCGVILFFIIIAISISSCEDPKICKAFNLKRVFYDTSYYHSSLKYMSAYDTIELNHRNSYISEESLWGSLGFDCNPRFEVSHSSIDNKLSILYTFEYFDNESGNDSTYLSIMIDNFNFNIKLNLDTIKNRLNESIFIDKIENIDNSKFSNKLKSVLFKRMKIVKRVFEDGTVYTLVP
jgi:hypothetical protein